jgi:type II secretory pathway component PulF
MPTFRYVAIDRAGLEVRGQLVSSDRRSAAGVLRERSLFVVRLQEGAGSLLVRLGSLSMSDCVRAVWRRLPITAADRVLLLRQLSLSRRNGIPLVEALAVCRDEAGHPGVSLAAERMRSAMLSGASLSEVMAGERRCFSEVVVKAAEAAEAVGELDRALDSAIAFVKRSSEWRRKLITALAYPLTVAMICGVIIGIIILKILPMLVEQTEASNLSESAKGVLATLQLAQWVSLAMFITLIAAAGSLVVVYRTGKGRRWLDRVLLSIPGIGRLVALASLSKICHTLSMLISGRVALVEALQLSAGLAGNHTIAQRLRRASHRVLSGRSLSDALRDSYIPARLIRSVVVGEQTGSLAEILRELAESLDTELETRLRRLLALAEPIVIVAVAVIVGLFVTMIYRAVLEVGMSLG